MANENFNGNITRRGFLGAACMAMIGVAGALTGCGESRAAGSVASGQGSSSASTEPSTSSALESSAANSSAADARAQAAASQEASAAAEGASSLVLVFSRAGENYGVGTVEVGNTMVLAQMIAEKTGSDLFELERATPYPDAYDACCDEALEEKNAGARPALADLPDLAGYDTVYFGFPCWWGDLPMPVYTAMEALDWNGKEVRPFNTHAGSGEAGMFATLAQKCSGATVTDGLTIAGTTAQNDRASAESQVNTWLSGFGA